MSEGRVSAVSLGSDPEGRWILGVIGRRTYVVSQGRLYDAPEQSPLVEVPQLADNGLKLLHDTDLMLRRAKADVIVSGHVYPFEGDRQTHLSVRVGMLRRRIAVFGDRRVTLDTLGRPVFSYPAAFERIPLGWERAYGGFDSAALETYGDPTDDLRREAGAPLTPETGFYSYPRNPLGRGYLTELSSKGVERCELPNFEEPAHLLSPDNLFYGNPLAWPEGPPSASTAWLPLGFFPRMTLVGLPPPLYDDEHYKPEDFYEVRAGLMPATSLDPSTHVSALPDLRGLQASAPAMRVDNLTPGDPVELRNAHPRQLSWGFALPSQPPRMVYRLPGGEPQDVTPVVRTVLLEPDEDRVTLVWVAEVPIHLPLTPEQLEAVQHAVVWRPSP